MERIDRIIGWGIFAVGLTHCLLTPLIFREFGTRALWFIGSGLAIMFQGAFNLLRARYGGVAPGLKKVCVMANLAGLAFAISFLLVRGVRAFSPHSFLLLALLAGATALSLLLPRPGIETIDGTVQS